MQAPRVGGVVRVTSPREAIEEATRLGVERKREGYSPEALVLAVDEILQDMPLSRAIVIYIQSSSRDDSEELPVERPFSWFSVMVAIGFALFCVWLVVLLYRFVGPDTAIISAFGLVICQAVLLNFAKRGVRLAFMSACDGLNDASYPTNLHPLRNANSAVGTLRLRRLRALMTETQERLKKGERAEDIERELAVVNLTPQAARVLVRVAQVNAVVRDYIPPYESRALGLFLAFAFAATCIFVIESAGNRIPEGFRNYAIGVCGWIAGDIAARPRRRPPRLPAS
jgi:hypothetical protein